jgi:hypothetical protein
LGAKIRVRLNWKDPYLRIVEEATTSIVNADSFFRLRSAAKWGIQDVEELVVGPSVPGDVNSTTSEMAMDKPFGFSECFGQSGDKKVDAIRALAKVAYNQEKHLEQIR